MKVQQLLALLFMSAATSHAVTLLYDGSSTDLNIFDNNNNSTGLNTLTGGTGALNFVNTHGNGNNSGIVSAGDVDSFLGRTILGTDTILFTMVVDEFTSGNLRSNGIEFGISPAATGFRPANNFLIQLDDAGAISGMAGNNFAGLGVNDAGWGVLETSLLDGFTVTLRADSAGYLFTVSDIVDSSTASITTRTFGGAFTGNEFVNNFGAGHIYFGAQKTTNPDINVNISEFSITLVPEPSRALLIAAGFGFCFLSRRRK